MSHWRFSSGHGTIFIMGQGLYETKGILKFEARPGQSRGTLLFPAIWTFGDMWGLHQYEKRIEVLRKKLGRRLYEFRIKRRYLVFPFPESLFENFNRISGRSIREVSGAFRSFQWNWDISHISSDQYNLLKWIYRLGRWFIAEVISFQTKKGNQISFLMELLLSVQVPSWKADHSSPSRWQPGRIWQITTGIRESQQIVQRKTDQRSVSSFKASVQAQISSKEQEVKSQLQKDHPLNSKRFWTYGLVAKRLRKLFRSWVCAGQLENKQPSELKMPNKMHEKMNGLKNWRPGKEFVIILLLLEFTERRQINRKSWQSPCVHECWQQQENFGAMWEGGSGKMRSSLSISPLWNLYFIKAPMPRLSQRWEMEVKTDSVSIDLKARWMESRLGLTMRSAVPAVWGRWNTDSLTVCKNLIKAAGGSLVSWTKFWPDQPEKFGCKHPSASNYACMVWHSNVSIPKRIKAFMQRNKTRESIWRVPQKTWSETIQAAT